MLALVLNVGMLWGEERPIPSALGPYVNLKESDFARTKSFGPDDKIVMTHYFYWYDVESQTHIIDGDGTDALTTHPADMRDFSYKSITWHKKQLNDMIAAGIDVVMPVYWGAPSEREPRAGLHWSYEGLGPLVEAADQLIREGKQPPRIGLFYDTSTLRHNGWHVHADLTTHYGGQWFYASIRDFFSMIPPRHWALIEGRPVIDLYSASFAKAHDQSAFDYLREQFAKDFGGRVPYVIREVSWNVKADSVYAWGGAIRANIRGIGEVGPGYDHSAVPGRAPLVVPRDGGKHYEEGWLAVLRRSPRIVAVETWNEFHEGTDIAESQEYGRQYIELTRKYVDLFKQGWMPPPVRGKYSGVKSVEVALGEKNDEHGLMQVEHEDGITRAAMEAGKPCREAAPTARPGRYIYFRIDDSFKWAAKMDVSVEVEYFDDESGAFHVEYDSHDEQATLNGAYTAAAKNVQLKGTKQWRTATFSLPNARFAGSQNAATDFRLVTDAPRFRVSRVVVIRQSESASRPGR